MKSIINLFRSFGRWVKKWAWTIPVQKPERTPPLKIPVTEVIDNYIVIIYHGQKVNLHRTLEYPIWKTYNRYDKRATALGFKRQEKDGKIRFEMIENKWICIKNLDYESRIKK